MQNSMVVFTFSILYQKHPFFYRLYDLMGVETLKQAAVVNILYDNMILYFVAVSAPVDCFCTLPEKLLNNLKPKQTFYESIFCLKIINCQILIELFI